MLHSFFGNLLELFLGQFCHGANFSFTLLTASNLNLSSWEDPQSFLLAPFCITCFLDLLHTCWVEFSFPSIPDSLLPVNAISLAIEAKDIQLLSHFLLLLFWEFHKRTRFTSLPPTFSSHTLSIPCESCDLFFDYFFMCTHIDMHI